MEHAELWAEDSDLALEFSIPCLEAKTLKSESQSRESYGTGTLELSSLYVCPTNAALTLSAQGGGVPERTDPRLTWSLLGYIT